MAKKEDKEKKPSPSPAPEHRDEIIQLDDGTAYRTVAGRKVKFNNDYPHGMINVELLTAPENKDYFVVKATVTPNVLAEKPRYFTGLGQCERIPGDKFASLEKAETTAIGRALSHMSNHILGAGASEEEIAKATGKNNLQAGVRETIKEEPKPTNPKAEPDSAKLEGDELSLYNDWAILLTETDTTELLTEIGKRIKSAELPSRVTEELRKLFNKHLRTLIAAKK